MKEINVLGIIGGPRKGNSAFFLKKAMEETSEMDIPVSYTEYAFQNKVMHPCIACHACTRNGGVCILRDDFEDLRSKWLAADVILYAFPVFAQGIPGQLKCFIDRLGNSLYGKFEVGSMRHMKTVVALTVGAHLFGGQELAINQIIQHAVLLNSIPISGNGPESYMGAPAWAGGSVSANALPELYEKKDADLMISLNAAKSCVRRAVEVAAILRTGALEMKEQLIKDKRYFAYFNKFDNASVMEESL